MIKPIGNEQRIDRRTVVKSAAAAAGITVLTGVAATLKGAGANQIDLGTPQPATPGATVSDPVTPHGPTIASKAAELGYDTERIFRFVADDVRYEAYAGALRGANGTLWSLAGNSVDKSILLSALLDEALVEHRFATGKLDDTGIATLTAAMVPDADLLMSSYSTAFAAGFAPQTSGVLGDAVAGPEPTLGDEDRAALNELSAMADKAFGLAQSLAETQLDIIGDALQAANIVLPALPAATLPDSERDRYTWVQVADGQGWIDYAPALSGDAPGPAPAEATETFSEVPADLYHNLTIKIIAEEYFRGTTIRRDAVTVTTTSSNTVNAPIAVAVLPGAALTGLGLTLNNIVSGDVTLIPVISGKGQVFAAQTPVVFGASGGAGGAFDIATEAGGIGDGETIALWLSIDVQSPGAETYSVERPLIDRLGFERTLLGNVDYTTVEPVTIVDAFGIGPTIPEMLSASTLHVESARLPLSFALNAQPNGDEPDVISIVAPCMSAFRDFLRIRSELDAGTASYIATPHLTLTGVSLVDALDPNSGAIVSLDLLRHETQVFPVGPSDNRDIHGLVLAGVLDEVAEEMALKPDSISVTDQPVAPGVGAVFTSAVDQDIPIVVVDSPDALDAIEASAEAKARIETALAESWIVVVPAQPVEIGTTMLSGWWLIDPATGRTRDELENGRGFAMMRVQSSGRAFSPLAEEEKTDEMAAEVQPWYRRLGNHLDCGYAIAAIALGVAGGAYSVATANPYSGAGSAVTVTKGIRDANKPFGKGGCRK